MTTQRTCRITFVLLIVGLCSLCAEAESTRRKQIQQAAGGDKPVRQSGPTSQTPQETAAQRPVTPAPQPQRQTGVIDNNRRLRESSTRRQDVAARHPSVQTSNPQSRPQKVAGPSLNKPIYQANTKITGKGSGEQATSHISKDIKYLNTRRIIRYVGDGSGSNPARDPAPSTVDKVTSQTPPQGSLDTPGSHGDSSTSLDRKDLMRGNRSLGTRMGWFQTRRINRSARLSEKGDDTPAMKSPDRVSQMPYPARAVKDIHNRHVTALDKPDRKEIVVDKHNWERQAQQYRCRSREVHVNYIDRPHVYARRYHHIYTVIGTSGQRYYRIIGPSSLFNICYQRGGLNVSVSLMPYYHRKYVFVSLGGHPLRPRPWIRYYWYGWHPYEWYGYSPLAYYLEGNTYNYYTYNYGDTGTPSSQDPGYNNTGITGYHIGSSEYMNVLDKRISSGDQDVTPSAAGPADIQFEQGVEAFDANDFAKAADYFLQASRYAPEDNMLALAYVQALFADNRYQKAADVLREVLERIQILEEGLFYPRGLYADDEILFRQIDALMRQAEVDGGNTDLQLLLGYQLLGIGEIDLARQPLENAGRDIVNNQGAKKLSSLLDIIEQQREQADSAPKQGQESK